MPTTQPKLVFRDLLAKHPPTPCLGRRVQQERIARTLRRSTAAHVILAGPPGIGKSTTIAGFVGAVASGQYSALRPMPYLQLDTSALTAALRDARKKDDAVGFTAEALRHLPPCVVVLDNADALLRDSIGSEQFDELFSPLLTQHTAHLILAISETTLETLRERRPACLAQFDIITVPAPSPRLTRRMIEAAAPRLSARFSITIERAALTAIAEQADKLPGPVALPQRALNLFDEACAAAVLAHHATLSSDTVERVAAERRGLPAATLTVQRQRRVQQLGGELRRAVRGQDHVVSTVTEIVQRGLLGLKNPRRPLGSFLFLGPSGVGKTELAKALARSVFGSEDTVIRLDMSEFSESHTAARLLGAPPGYVGYEAGGQLTTPVAAQPFSLVLLDEIEKAHPSVFDLFLHVLDDGRLTDGQGTTVDFTKTIIIATSNIGSRRLLQAAQQHEDVTTPAFVREAMFPLLLEHCRPELLNRFEAIRVFRPLTPADLLEIAKLEIAKTEQRFAHLHLTVTLDEVSLTQRISELYDPLLGARPIKRFIEQACETALAEQLLAKPLL